MYPNIRWDGVNPLTDAQNKVLRADCMVPANPDAVLKVITEINAEDYTRPRSDEWNINAKYRTGQYYLFLSRISCWPVILVVGFTHSDRPASSRLKEKMYADLSGSSLADQIKRQPSKPIWLDEWFIRIARWELSSASTPETGGKKWNQYPNRVRRESAEKMCDARYARPPWFPNHYSRVLNVCSISSHCWKRPL